MIEIFQTNVEEAGEAGRVVAVLKRHFPSSRINFDLHDCDRILRVEGEDFQPRGVEQVVQAQGYHCRMLE